MMADTTRPPMMMGHRRVTDNLCECSMEGVMSFCAAEHTPTTFEAIKDCVVNSDREALQEASAAAANPLNDGEVWMNTCSFDLHIWSSHG